MSESQSKQLSTTYSDRKQKAKDRSSPRVRFFKPKHPEIHGIAVRAYPFHEVAAFFNILVEIQGDDPQLQQLCNQLAQDGRIPESIIKQQALWNQAIHSSCKASVLMLFQAHLEGKTELLIPTLQSREGLALLRNLQHEYEHSWKDTSVPFLASHGWQLQTKEKISIKEVATRLIDTKGYYELTFSNQEATHVIAVTVDDENVTLMDINRGLVMMARKDFPIWFNKQNKPIDEENRKLSYLRAYKATVIITQYAPSSPSLSLQAKL